MGDYSLQYWMSHTAQRSRTDPRRPPFLYMTRTVVGCGRRGASVAGGVGGAGQGVSGWGGVHDRGEGAGVAGGGGGT